MLHLGAAATLIDEHVVDRCVTLVESTSPSSLLTASLDAARSAGRRRRARSCSRETLAALARTREAIREIPGLDVLDERLAGAPGVFDYDPLRLAIDVRGTRHERLRAGAAPARASTTCDLELSGENVMVAVFGMGEDAARPSARLVAALRGAVERGAPDERDASAGQFAAAAAVGRAGDDAARGVPRAAGGGAGAATPWAAWPPSRSPPTRPGIPNVLPGERLTARDARLHRADDRRTAAACAGRATARCAPCASSSRASPPARGGSPASGSGLLRRRA